MMMVVYNNKKCPICGHGIHEGVQCGRERARLHIAHCYDCRYFVKDFVHCRYADYRRNQERIAAEHGRVYKMIEDFKGKKA